MKIKFITLGCSRNQADTEFMKSLLIEKGHQIVERNEDVLVVNTCFVKKESEKKAIKILKSYKKKIVLAGCLAQDRPQLIEAFPNISIIGVYALPRIVDAVESQVVDVSRHEFSFSNLNSHIIPISDGCVGSCAFCCTRHSRGTLKSRPIKDIVSQILNTDKKDIWITSQDTGCYGFDKGITLIDLLKELSAIEKDIKIRIGMMNPEHALRLLPELKEILNKEKFYKFIHIPVQSGSNKVLKDMNRKYTVEDFLYITKKFSNFTIATDIICGYPTETEEDWVQTKELIKKVKPLILHINRFFPRPGTPASMLKQLPLGIPKKRSRELSEIYKNYALEENKKLIGSIRKVLMVSENEARDMYYRPIIVSGTPNTYTKVRITGASIYHLKAENLST